MDVIWQQKTAIRLSHLFEEKVDYLGYICCESFFIGTSVFYKIGPLHEKHVKSGQITVEAYLNTCECNGINGMLYVRPTVPRQRKRKKTRCKWKKKTNNLSLIDASTTVIRQLLQHHNKTELFGKLLKLYRLPCENVNESLFTYREEQQKGYFRTRSKKVKGRHLNQKSRVMRVTEWG
jgi:hypothetical protein